MSAIPCASVSLKTMADGTLRISFDIEPMHAQDAFRLFAAPGTPAAIAALQVGYAAATNIEPPPNNAPNIEKPKGGPLSKLAAMWCNQPEFWTWLETDDENAAHSEFGATMCVYALCGIESRAELDHDEIAAEKFHRLIRGPYSKYLQARGAI
jgi:hypothetical protein